MKVFEPKILSALKGYTAKQAVSDIVAGVIVAIIALPLSIALAIASGATPETGLYTAIFAGFTISLLGGSKVNIKVKKRVRLLFLNGITEILKIVNNVLIGLLLSLIQTKVVNEFMIYFAIALYLNLPIFFLLI